MRIARARCDIISAMADYRPDGPTATHDEGPDADKLVANLPDISARLARLEWYEPVARSRRKRAIRVFDTTRRRARRESPPAFLPRACFN